MNILKQFFGESIITPNLRVTDILGNCIHRHVWHDLLETGMTIIVDTGSFSPAVVEDIKAGKQKLRVNGSDNGWSSSLQSHLKGYISTRPSKEKMGAEYIFPRHMKSEGQLKSGNGGIGGTPTGQPMAKPTGGGLGIIVPAKNRLMPADKVGEWASQVVMDSDAEEKRVTTVTMFVEGEREHNEASGKEKVQGRGNESSIQIFPTRHPEFAGRNPRH